MSGWRCFAVKIPVLAPVLAAAVALATSAPPLSAQDVGAPAPRAAPAAEGGVVLPGEEGDRVALAVARRMLAAGAYAQAMEILVILERRRPGDGALQVLMAQTEVALAQYNAAIARLERLRDARPDWPRPRIELALAHAAAGDVRAGKAILIAELGKDPPEPVRRNIEQAIRNLEDRQSFVGRFNAGIVPDSNANDGSSSNSVQYLGLPFTLNDDARQQSGVRAEVSAGGTLRGDWRENTRLEIGADFYHSEPLDDEGAPSSNLRLALAARLRGPDGGLRAGLAVQPFYFDNELQRIERSLFIEPARRLYGPLAAAGSLTLTEGRYNDAPGRDFRQWEAAAGPILRIGRATRLQVTGIFGHRNAEDDLYSFLRRGGSARLVSAPMNGWRLSLAGAVTRDVFEEFNVPFGRRQEDIITAASVDLVRTGWVFFGVSPRVGLSYSRVRSNIDLYDRDSIALTLGFALPY